MLFFENGLPLVSQSSKTLRDKLAELSLAKRAMKKELERRGDRDEWKWGFIAFRPLKGGGGYETVYAVFNDREEAAKAWVEQSSDDLETARYRVLKVYLGKSDN